MTPCCCFSRSSFVTDSTHIFLEYVSALWTVRTSCAFLPSSEHFTHILSKQTFFPLDIVSWRHANRFSSFALNTLHLHPLCQHAFLLVSVLAFPQRPVTTLRPPLTRVAAVSPGCHRCVSGASRRGYRRDVESAPGLPRARGWEKPRWLNTSQEVVGWRGHEFKLRKGKCVVRRWWREWREGLLLKTTKARKDSMVFGSKMNDFEQKEGRIGECLGRRLWTEERIGECLGRRGRTLNRRKEG